MSTPASPPNRDDARARLRMLREAQGADPGKSLRTAQGMLAEARDMLLASKRHLQGASTETIFALGALSSQIEAVSLALRADLDRITATASLFGMIEKTLSEPPAG
ncbi:MAG: hypothetical protein ACRYHQ_31340 [Janthinobacterium lividum]